MSGSSLSVGGLLVAGALTAFHLSLLLSRLHRARWSLAWMSSALSGGDPPVQRASGKTGARLVVLLPCLNEQSLVDETLSYFSSMPGVAEGRVLLVPVTGESEAALNRAARERIPEVARLWWAEFSRDTFVRHNRGLLPLTAYDDVAALRKATSSGAEFGVALARRHRELPTTWWLVDRWIERHTRGDGRNRVLRLHEPATQGSKSTKLNFALDTLRRTHPQLMQDPRTYVAVYDFDSRPARGTFAWVLREVDERAARGAPLPTVFQQVPHQLGSAMAELPPTSLPYLWAINHLERTLGLEAFDNADEMVRPHRYPGRPRICMGAGMHLRARDLAHTGSFPGDSDDIAFGHRLEWLGCRRALIPHPNLVQPVPSAAVLVRQARRIFRTVWAQRRELGWVRRHRPDTVVPRVRTRMLAARVADHHPEWRFVTFTGAVLLAAAAHSLAAGLALGAVLYAADTLALLALVRMGTRVAALHGQGFRPRALLRSALAGALTVPALRTGMAVRVLAERWVPAVPPARAGSLPALAELKTDR